MKKNTTKKLNSKTGSNVASQSLENLATSSRRKASTPIQDRTAASVSPDISYVLTDDVNKSTCSLKQRGDPLKENVFKKPILMKSEDMERELNYEYTTYLQTAFKKKLMEKQSCEIDEKINGLQKRIADNQRILQLTTNRLKNVQFHKEIELLHSLQNPDYGRILETHNSSNIEQYLLNLNEKLELSQNQLKVKDIELPEGGAGQLLGVITDTLNAFEKMKKESNAEACKTLAETKSFRKEVEDTISRCAENLQIAEDTLLTSATMKLSHRIQDGS